MELPIQPLPHVIEDIEKWPIFKLYTERDKLVQEINKNAVRSLRTKYTGKLDKLLARTIYMEKIRMREEPWNADPQNEPLFWKKIQKSLPDSSAEASEIQNRSEYLLRKIIERYAEEIAGGFKKKTFLVARRILSFFFRRLLNAASAKNIFYILRSKYKINERIKLFGPLDKIRALSKEGVLVIVPTHSSNMDSILIGFALDEIAGLPAFSYGAGLNLYNSELFGYFMNRLGAYRVDRRKKNPVYLETLKAMSNISLQWGTNTLFFPGGTRSRSGSLETKLKLGLLGTAVEAQREILRYGNKRKIFIVPVVLNYHCVLEARYLIEQHLRSIGKDAYLGSSRDEFKSFKNIFVFLYRLLSKSSEIALSFGSPLDVIGNEVNDEGISLDQKGQCIKLEDYFISVEAEGEATEAQRDNVYTSVLAEKIVTSYHKHNVVFSTNLVAYCAFKTIQKHNPNLDVFALLRLGLDEVELDPAMLGERISTVQAILIEAEKQGNIRLDNSAVLPPLECIADAINSIGVFHSIKPLKYSKQGKVTSGNLKMLYFYHNRLDTYEFLKQYWNN